MWVNEKLHSRWLALGLLGLGLLMVILFAIVPLVSTALEYHEQKEELLFRLQRAKQVIARKDSIEENITQISQKHQKQNYFSWQNTVALASADLQKIIKSAISQAGGQLTSTQVLPSRNDASFNRVTVKVRMSGDIEVLRSVLYEIETSVPMMIVDQLDIRPVRGKRNRKTRKIEPNNKLNVNFQVASFMRVEGS
ncbi:MAG: type II secretion system protein M [Methylococcales bacterium]|nr:type II secretion system protein M [Methylococcales bacterium]